MPYRATEGHGTRQLQLDRVNLGYDPEVIVTKPLMLVFLGDLADAVNKPPDLGTALSNTVVDASVRTTFWGRMIYARPVKDATGCATFPAQQGVTGTVCGTPPASGEFAPAAMVGLTYNRNAFCTATVVATATR